MRQFKVPGGTTYSTQTGLSKGEKRKLFGLLLGLLLVGFILVKAVTTSQEYREAETAELPSDDDGFEEAVAVPEVDAQRLDALVRDDEKLERVVIETDALDLLLEDVRRLTSRHFEVLETRELGATLAAELLADPAAHRGQPILARGRVDALRTRQRGPGQPAEHIGRLLLADGTPAYFLVLDAPEDPTWLRVEGLFLKVYTEELFEEPGTWLDGPLLVGPRAIQSFRDLGTVATNDWMALYDVADADLRADPPRVVRQTPFEPLWHLMAYARDLPADTIPWDEAPVLDTELLDRLAEEPATWRFQPIRIPISRIQDARVKRAGENPARIERYTQGWIGNTTWNNVIHFKAPWVDPELKLRDYAEGRGFFLHNFAYDPRAHDLRTAPVFVMHTLERIVPREDPTLVTLAYVIAGGAMVLLCLFFFLLLRDKQRARVLQEELVRRRRARRARGDVGPGEMGPATS